ncbi:hypothetical protein [Segetibacter koreensis]|uniref:hypothetical protein n=1 Tax=Segetibacter koreensis TaxID=398037 RepID=UPI00039FD769|nr:hypothetical protein [Segetibacter koreensis]
MSHLQKLKISTIGTYLLYVKKRPSFKVNSKLNYWYDHGIGKGGNVIDFAILYHNCTVGEFLQELKTLFLFTRLLRHQQK